MSRIRLMVNGEPVEAEVAPRTHLADFLREDRLLTGTHLGCEHGVCGACTLLIDGGPARSCIAFAVACDGADVRTIEGLEDDPLVVRLRGAFTVEHALQCGYCTPGMLITARDIVQRLPDADEARIRLELAGNLCRCTGYAGIVRAIRRVLADGITVPRAAPAQLPRLPSSMMPQVVAGSYTPDAPGETQFAFTLRLDVPLAATWSAIHDPRLIAACVPGATLDEVNGDRLRGELRAAFGPIETWFQGEGVVLFDETRQVVEVSGKGRDSTTGTRLSARIVLQLRESDATHTDANMTIDYTLRGPLAQFARGGIPKEFAADVGRMFAVNLAAHVNGSQPPKQQRLSVGLLLLRAVWRRLLSIGHVSRSR
jgi:aerobic carbon-monoxide dehydrogenase small subunit